MYITIIKFWCAKNFILVTRSGTFPALAAQDGVRLPPTLKADKPEISPCSIMMMYQSSKMALVIVPFGSF